MTPTATAPLMTAEEFAERFQSESLVDYRTGELTQTRHNSDELTPLDMLSGFAVPVKAFFE